MSDHLVTAEASNSKLVAVFRTTNAACAAAEALVASTDIEKPQLKLVAAGEADIGIKLEPEGGNIWRTIIVSHVRLGLVGALTGLMLFGALWALGVPFVISSPWAAAGAAIFFGVIAGLLFGGLVTLRPDHSAYVDAARNARDSGLTTLVVHALSAEQRSRAAKLLGEQGADVTQTL